MIWIIKISIWLSSTSTLNQTIKKNDADHIILYSLNDWMMIIILLSTFEWPIQSSFIFVHSFFLLLNSLLMIMELNESKEIFFFLYNDKNRIINLFKIVLILLFVQQPLTTRTTMLYNVKHFVVAVVII